MPHARGRPHLVHDRDTGRSDVPVRVYALSVLDSAIPNFNLSVRKGNVPPYIINGAAHSTLGLTLSSSNDSPSSGFNVPHQAATWYAMYRVARFYTNIKTVHPWQYYLQEAYQLTNTLGTPNVGLMDDTVFREIMNALLAEGADNTTIRGWGTRIQGNMQQRAADWNTQVFPYGSECKCLDVIIFWYTYFFAPTVFLERYFFARVPLSYTMHACAPSHPPSLPLSHSNS